MKRRRTSYNVNSVSEKLKTNPQKEIFYAEKVYRSQIRKVANSLASRRIILLSGPSASGKTTSANKICELLRSMGHKCEVVSLDNFYHNREHLPIINGKPNAEVVESLSVSLIHKTIDNLLSLGSSYIPHYDFILGKRTNDASFINIGNDGVVIFEGIHALNPKINKGIDENLILKIYVSPHSDFVINGTSVLSKREVRFIRRLIRDSWSRNSSSENTFNMWPSVCEGEDELIRPFAEFADLYINTTHSYEPFLMKNKAISLLKEINQDSPYWKTAREYIKKLDKFLQIDINLLPRNSLLCEFINIYDENYIH